MGIESAILAVTLARSATGFLLLPRWRHGGRSLGSHPALPVSVIIPARNEENKLPAWLQSLASQATKPHEIIVVDDGSTDRAAEWARQLGATVIASKPLPGGGLPRVVRCGQNVAKKAVAWDRS